MSVIDEIRKLDEKKADLIASAKLAAITLAESAIKDLAELGMEFHLVEGRGPSSSSQPRAARAPSESGRRTGIRGDVLRVVEEHGEGVSSADVRKALGLEGKADSQAVSNALSALKKNGSVSLNGGLYKAG